MFHDIKQLIPKSVKRAGVIRQIEEAQILDLFSEMLFRHLPRGLVHKVQPMYIRNGVLHVASLSDIAVDELEKEERKIIQSINKKVGFDVIGKIMYLS